MGFLRWIQLSLPRTFRQTLRWPRCYELPPNLFDYRFPQYKGNLSCVWFFIWLVQPFLYLRKNDIICVQNSHTLSTPLSSLALFSLDQNKKLPTATRNLNNLFYNTHSTPPARDLWENTQERERKQIDIWVWRGLVLFAAVKERASPAFAAQEIRIMLQCRLIRHGCLCWEEVFWGILNFRMKRVSREY